jgi:hypothetical protein
MRPAMWALAPASDSSHFYRKRQNVLIRVSFAEPETVLGPESHQNVQMFEFFTVQYCASQGI